MIHSITEDYVTLFTIINIVEFVIGLFMFCVPDKRGVQEYLICMYGGFFFGAVPLYMLFDSMIAIFIGCMCLSIIFIFANYYWMKKVIPIGVVLFKINLIFGSIWFGEYYFNDRLDFFYKAMLFTMIILFVIDLCYVYDLSENNKRILISGLFGVLELSGSIMQFYRMDYTSFNKDLYSKRESVSLILCLLKVDFWIYDYQYYFLFIIIALLIIFFVWRRTLLTMTRLIENHKKNKR